MIFVPFFLVYVLAAVLPAAILLRYIYRHDTIEKEPPGLMILLVLMGVVSALAASVLEMFGQGILNFLVTPGTRLHTILLAFVVVAAVEEGTKLWLLKQRSWHHPAFNYRFDGIVYSVAVSLGFAAYENIQYVLHYGLSVALPRALLAVPGHMSFAVCMGIYYGRAKLCENWGNPMETRKNLRKGYLYAVFLHGFYDACAMLGTGGAAIVFLLFVVVMFITVFKHVKRESRTDAPL